YGLAIQDDLGWSSHAANQYRFTQSLLILSPRAIDPYFVGFWTDNHSRQCDTSIGPDTDSPRQGKRKRRRARKGLESKKCLGRRVASEICQRPGVGLQDSPVLLELSRIALLREAGIPQDSLRQIGIFPTDFAVYELSYLRLRQERALNPVVPTHVG